MTNVIAADSIGEPVKNFLNRLEVSSEASMIEFNGRRVYVVVRPSQEDNKIEEAWTDEKSKRRHLLIDCKHTSGLQPLQIVELAELDLQFERHLEQVAPLPIAYARDLLEKLTTHVNGGYLDYSSRGQT